MKRELLSSLILLFVGLTPQRVATNDRIGAGCPVTRPANPPFVPAWADGPRDAPKGMFWYGDEELWTLLGGDGTWSEPIPEGCEGFCTKLVYWARNFDRTDAEPKLIVTARQLDHEAPLITASKANVVFVGGSMPTGMMTTIDIPRSGCWEITAHYQHSKLAFVRSVLVRH